MRLIQILSDGTKLTYDKGSFDDWCIYLTKPGKTRYAPTDLEYFTRLAEMGKRYGFDRIYNDFVRIYLETQAEIDVQVLNLIARLSKDYGSDQLEIETWFTLIYAGMVAEENKEKAILKKRIKRLGMHQLLVDRLSPEMAANYSRGKKWTELNQICLQKGF